MAFTKDWYIENFRKLENDQKFGTDSGIYGMRKEAIGSFITLGFPSLKNEDWKYTNISPILNFGFLPDTKTTEVDARIISAYEIKGIDANTVVLVNGNFIENLCRLDLLPHGVLVTSIASALKSHPDLIRDYFGKNLQYENGFIALNTAYANDGVFIFIPENTKIEKPIHIINITGSDEEEILSQPRNIVVAANNSKATVIETYNSFEGKSSFTNIITEVNVGEGANIQIFKIQNESSNAFHISRLQAEQRKNSVFTAYTVTTGGSLVRNDISTVLSDEGCETHLYGLYLTNGTQHVDNHTLIDHAKPHCLSNELYKGVLNDKSHAVFNGKVFVRQDAQKTNAYQSNKNILLSRDASVDTKPQLEIYADDVRCTHGATVGQLDDESVFYLRSRGIPKDLALKILIRAFADDVFENITIEPLHEHIQKLIFEKLSL